MHEVQVVGEVHDLQMDGQLVTQTTGLAVLSNFVEVEHPHILSVPLDCRSKVE